MSRYMNPFTDFGFKRLFGEEANKELLIDFLNALLEGEQVIRDLTYLKNEQLGDAARNRRAVFDIYCENERGEKFIVEMQKMRQEFFKDRTVFYSAFPIREQSIRDSYWDFNMRAVYTIGLLNFRLDDSPAYRHDVKLVDLGTGEVFFDKLTYIYLEMPKFKLEEAELATRVEKWMYALNNLFKLNDMPEGLREEIFERFFREAEIAQFSQQDQLTYQDSLKQHWDWNGVLNTAKKEGLAEGRAEGRAEGLEAGQRQEKLETIRRCLAMGMVPQAIAGVTGMDAKEIEGLMEELE